ALQQRYTIRQTIISLVRMDCGEVAHYALMSILFLPITQSHFLSRINKILKNPFYAGIIEYHKQFTPDFIEQKKINNFGEIKRIRVDGRHKPIVTIDEFNRVQAIMEEKRKINPANRTGRKEKGKCPASDVWCKLLVCDCGCTFNRKVWHNTSQGVQYGYMCYSQIRNGTIKTRINKGLLIDGFCTSQMIAGWKLQFMAKHLFREFLKDTDRILNIAEEMLKKHIQDKKEIEDNTEIIQRKQAELSKLENRLSNLITMRADGEVDKKQFQTMKSEIDNQIHTLQEQIKRLAPEEPEEEEEIPDYSERITVLRYVLERYLNFDSDEDIPEQVIEAFVEKIVVRENTFDWYLLFTGDDKAPKSCNVTGNKKSHKIELYEEPETLSFVSCNTGCNSKQVITTRQS
ncbi:MAG: recombinase family protein, partial [Ruminococcus sp.]|nr:recombinase family protein [Ruminococcus sp.]